MVLNFTSPLPAASLYAQGYLPQRNRADLWYHDTSSRSNLADFNLSSENRRILKNTQQWLFKLSPITDFKLTPEAKKQIINWTRTLGWNFPPSSVKTVFQNHRFNYLYQWYLPHQPVTAYALSYQDPSICHIAYVFYDPSLQKSNLPIRLVLQAVIDSHDAGRQYCYLGGFNPQTKYGYYKRTMPGFEYFTGSNWQPLLK